MVSNNEVHRQAKSLTNEVKRRILKSYKETEIHAHLKQLYLAMEHSYTVEITHGASERGKDLVIVKKDKLGIDVIGIIVKVGDIKGKTIGDVDEINGKIKDAFSYKSKQTLEEIESQIHQAFTYPAELKDRFNRLPVNKVYVVLVGLLSNQARDRIQGEIIDGRRAAVEIFDLNWIVDNLTEYYPQSYFEGAVIDFLQKKIQDIELSHYQKRTDKNLTEYFVEPLVAESEVPVNIDSDSLKFVIGKNKFDFSRLKALITSDNRIVLVGDPGTGKSGSLAYLAIDMLKDASKTVVSKKIKRDIEIPVLVRAQDILDAKDLDELLVNYGMTKEIRDKFSISVLMVDALDEVVLKKRADIIEKGKSYASELACSLVVTSRKIDYINKTPVGFKKYELLPFELGQALKLVSKVVSDRKKLSSLRSGVEQMGKHFQMVPLSLMLLIEIVEHQEEVPASVTELYDRYFDFSLGRFDKDKGIEVLFEYFIKKKFLAWLAYNAYYNEKKLIITKDDFFDYVTTYGRMYDWSSETKTIFLEEIQRSGVIDIRDEIEFKHRSFLDYFTAFHMFEERSEITNLKNKLVNLFYDDVWSDVPFFYIGMRREINDTTVDAILGIKKDDLNINTLKYSIGRLLQAGWNTTTVTKRNGIRKALKYVPKIKEQFDEMVKKYDKDATILLPDVYVMQLSEFSFGSIFLKDQILDIIVELLDNATVEDMLLAAGLVYSCIKLMRDDEIESMLKIYEEIILEKKVNPQEKIRLYIIMLLANRERKKYFDKINKKLIKVIKQNPEIAKSVLPVMKRGFRIKK